MTFEAVVADWLRANGYGDVAVVTRCDGDGTDWAGSTEGGFYEEFRVSVTWEASDGRTHYDDVAGERMQSLWMHVVGAWGTDGS